MVEHFIKFWYSNQRKLAQLLIHNGFKSKNLFAVAVITELNQQGKKLFINFLQQFSSAKKKHPLNINEV